MKNICVYCGSSAGSRPSYSESAKDLGKVLSSNGLSLVYGGGGVGLMGIIADSVMSSGGEVIGVIPKALFDRDLGKNDITKLHIVGTMHERKAKMEQLSDAFIAMPGGIGTLEEFSEAVTWLQLGIHCKPCGLLNVDGYYDDLIKFFERSDRDGFFRHILKTHIAVSKDPNELLDMLKKSCAKPSALPHWREILE